MSGKGDDRTCAAGGEPLETFEKWRERHHRDGFRIDKLTERADYAWALWQALRRSDMARSFYTQHDPYNLGAAFSE